MQFAGSSFEIKTLTSDGQIEGLLAAFGDVDHGGDKLLAGCLTKSLASRTAPLPMLLHHDLHRPIGAWKEWSEKASGLYVKGQLTLATRDAQEAHALAKDGALTGLSIGWMAKKATFDNEGARLVAEAELFEGSLVAVPMNDRTRVASIKGFAGPRDIAELLQAKGFSGHAAREAGGVLWTHIIEQNEAADIEADLAAIEQAKAASDEAELVAIVEASVARLTAQGGR